MTHIISVQVSKFPHKLFGPPSDPMSGSNKQQFTFTRPKPSRGQSGTSPGQKLRDARGECVAVGESVPQPEEVRVGRRTRGPPEQTARVQLRVPQGQHERPAILFCDAFFSYVQIRGEEKQTLDAPTDLQVLLTLHNRPEFRPKLVATAPLLPSLPSSW